MRHRADRNQQEIVDALRGIGASVLVLSQVGGGAPDLLVAKGENILMEVKTKSGKLRKGQQEFMNTWQGPVYVVRTIEEAINLVVNAQQDVGGYPVHGD
jgi:hypothetical protein